MAMDRGSFSAPRRPAGPHLVAPRVWQIWQTPREAPLRETSSALVPRTGALPCRRPCRLPLRCRRSRHEAAGQAPMARDARERVEVLRGGGGMAQGGGHGGRRGCGARVAAHAPGPEPVPWQLPRSACHPRHQTPTQARRQARANTGSATMPLLQPHPAGARCQSHLLAGRRTLLSVGQLALHRGEALDEVEQRQPDVARTGHGQGACESPPHGQHTVQHAVSTRVGAPRSRVPDAAAEPLARSAGVECHAPTWGR